MIVKPKNKNSFADGGWIGGHTPSNSMRMPEINVNVVKKPPAPYADLQPVGRQPDIAIINAGEPSGVTSSPNMDKAGKEYTGTLKQLLTKEPEHIRDTILSSPKYKDMANKVVKIKYDEKGMIQDISPQETPGFSKGGEVKAGEKPMDEKKKKFRIHGMKEKEPKSPLKGLAEGGTVAAQDTPPPAPDAAAATPQPMPVATPAPASDAATPPVVPPEPSAGSPAAAQDKSGPLDQFAEKGVDKATVDEGNQLFKDLATAIDADDTEAAQGLISDIKMFAKEIGKSKEGSAREMVADINDLVSAYENMIVDRGDSIEAKAERGAAKSPVPEVEAAPPTEPKKDDKNA